MELGKEGYLYDLMIIDNFSTSLIEKERIEHSIEFLSFVVKFPARVKLFISVDEPKSFMEKIEKQLYFLPYLNLIKDSPVLNLEEVEEVLKTKAEKV